MSGWKIPLNAIHIIPKVHLKIGTPWNSHVKKNWLWISPQESDLKLTNAIHYPKDRFMHEILQIKIFFNMYTTFLKRTKEYNILFPNPKQIYNHIQIPKTENMERM